MKVAGGKLNIKYTPIIFVVKSVLLRDIDVCEKTMYFKKIIIFENLMPNVAQYLNSLFLRVKTMYRKNPRITAFLGILIFASILAMFFVGNGVKKGVDESTRVPLVHIASVYSLSTQEESLRILGEVRSVSQAELRAQKSGKVTQSYISPGQFVRAGTILAEIENAGERAAVLSAQGALSSAQAQLDKTLAGARSEDKTSTVVQAETALVTLAVAQDSARSAYSQAYTLAQDAVYAQADDFFSNQNTVDPSFRIRTASYDERLVIGRERVRIGELLRSWEKKITTGDVSNDVIDARLDEAGKNLEEIKNFLNQISGFISEQEVGDGITSAEKEDQEGTILAARTSIDGARGVVNGARTGLANARNASQIANLTESKTIGGARREDVAAAEALVTQARGALASAYAALEYSLIRTPISGTVTTFSVAKGDFISAFESVAVVANEGAIEIEAFVSGGVHGRIFVGAPVLVEGLYKGTVTSVAPGLDPTTKRARITVGVSDDTSLVNGAFVEIEIRSSDEELLEEREIAELSIPITAIKVLPRTMAVFIVDEQNTLIAVPITEGPIIGSKMIIPEGLTPEMHIVTDARGLSEGDVVEVVIE